jgi:PAS domain S-box-containing protein
MAAPSLPSILLVDDHLPNLLALEALLKPLELRIFRAASGTEAIEHLTHGDFAAVLLDLQMPGMDGFETAALIRRHERNRDVPILFVTAGTMSAEDTRKGYALGAFDYLTKPLNPDAFRAKVSVLVDLWRRGESIRVREAEVHERERAALRSAIQQTEAELRLIIDGVRDHAISLLDPTGRIRTFNAPAERIKGYRLDEVQGRHFEMFFTQEDREAGLPERELREAASRGRFEIEGWRQRKDGSRFYAAVSLSALRGPDGRLVGFVKVTQDITERRQLSDALRLREAELRLIIDGVRDHAISLLDPEGRIRTFNASAERIKGYKLAEVQGRHFEMFFTPEDRATGLPERELATARVEGRAELEGWRQKKDGSRFYAAVSISALRDENGGLVGFVKVTQDITQRRELAEALRAREQQLQLILDAIPGLVAYVNPDETYRTANRRHADWFGIRPEEATGQPVAAVIGDAAFAAVRPHLQRALAGQAVSFESEIAFAGLGLRCVRAEYVPDVGDGGEVRGAITLVVDVTDAKRAAERLAEEAAVNETLYRIGGAFNTKLDLDSIFQQLTDEATKVCRAQFGAFFYNVENADQGSYMLYALSGVARENFAGFPMPRNTEVFAPTFRGEGVVRTDDITKDPRYGRNAPYHGMPPGHLPVRSYLAVPVVSRSGMVHGGLFFGHAEVGVFKERDERVIVAIAGQAAVAIDNARLLETVRRERARAEEANRAKDLFLGTLSHELRTPLNAIIGWTRMLRSGSLPEEKRARALEIIDRNARAQAALIEDILDLSRITSGKMRLEVAPVELAHIVETALDTIRPAADAKGVRIQPVLDPDSGTVHGDATRLQQVCWNLLSNAVKFTPRGGRVYVKLVRTDSQVELLVSDTGKGIANDFLPWIFDPFSQADSTSTREYGGLGLGLAIVKHLVELHGGTVRAESEGAGKGTTFVVRLPVAPVRPRVSDPPVTPTIATPSGPHIDCPPELAGLRVLIVDDEPDARELLRTVLESCSAQVTTASTATDALQQFKREPPDLLVSDIGMQDKDGYWLIREIRGLPPEQGGRVPAVAITAYAGMKDRTRALREGFTNHVAKPTEPQELLAVVAASVGRTAIARNPGA